MNVHLMPPQQYELARLAKFESLDNLLEFAMDRSKIGVQLNFPVSLKKWSLFVKRISGIFVFEEISKRFLVNYGIYFL